MSLINLDWVIFFIFLIGLKLLLLGAQTIIYLYPLVGDAIATTKFVIGIIRSCKISLFFTHLIVLTPLLPHIQTTLTLSFNHQPSLSNCLDGGRLGGGVSHVRRVTRLGSCVIWSCCSSWRYWGVIMVRWLAHNGIMVLLACNVQRNHISVIQFFLPLL